MSNARHVGLCWYEIKTEYMRHPGPATIDAPPLARRNTGTESVEIAIELTSSAHLLARPSTTHGFVNSQSRNTSFVEPESKAIFPVVDSASERRSATSTNASSSARFSSGVGRVSVWRYISVSCLDQRQRSNSLLLLDYSIQPLGRAFPRTGYCLFATLVQFGLRLVTQFSVVRMHFKLIFAGRNPLVIV